MSSLSGRVAGAILSITVLATMAVVPASAKTIFGGTGSPGDRTDVDECPPGLYMVGVAGRVGSWIDQIRILCARVNSSGSFERNSYQGPIRGGNTGGPAQDECPIGAAIQSIDASYTEGNRQVKWLKWKCTQIGNAPAESGSFSGAGDTNVNFDTLAYGGAQCRSGEAATGLTISSGRHVNSLALICDTIALPAASPSGGAVIARTGRTPAPGASIAPIQAFQGGWQTVTNQNGHFTLILQIANPGQNPFLTDTYVTGQFINTDGATQYNGIIQGTIPRGTRTLHYSYSQPQIKAGGQGHFTLSNDGNAIAGNGTAGGQTFTWNGTRAR